MSSSHHKKKKKAHGGGGTPDLFWTSYGSLITILLAFFIIFQVNFTEAKKKEFVDMFKQSLYRSKITFGLGGVLPGGDTVSSDDIRKIKYIFESDQKEPSEVGDKGVESLDRVEGQVPAAVVIHFEENDSTLYIDGEHALDNLIDLIGERPCSLTIEGHSRIRFAPSKGYQNCWKLSIDRANVVADYLHNKGNISWKRLITVGYGSNKPLTKDPIGDKQNDRVSIIINILK